LQRMRVWNSDSVRILAETETGRRCLLVGGSPSLPTLPPPTGVILKQVGAKHLPCSRHSSAQRYSTCPRGSLGAGAVVPNAGEGVAALWMSGRGVVLVVGQEWQ